MTMDVEWTDDVAGPPAVPGFFTVTMTDANKVEYKGIISKERAIASQGGNTVMLKNQATDADPNDTITITYPNIKDLGNFDSKTGVFTEDTKKPLPAAKVVGTATPSAPSKKLGWGKSTFTLEGGTEFYTQDIRNLTGIGIGADGTITGTSDAGLQILGRIDIANFGNAKGLAQSGNSYFTETANSGKASICIAGEQGTGAIRNSALEMSNVDLAQEFSDMIVTQRGFQASSRMITVSDTMLEELINLKR